MAYHYGVDITKSIIGTLDHNADLLTELTQVCKNSRIEMGCVEAIGAVKKARIGYYLQDKQEYQFIELNQPLEITNLTGNISLKNNEIMVHAHITLADEKGNCFGGHLGTDTIVFAGEFIIHELEGVKLERLPQDKQTGLPLWDMRQNAPRNAPQ